MGFIFNWGRWGYLTAFGLSVLLLLFFQNCSPVSFQRGGREKERTLVKEMQNQKNQRVPTVFEYIKSADFESDPLGPYSFSDMKKDFGDADPYSSVSYRNMSVVQESQSFSGKSLRILMPKNKTVRESGTSLRLRLPPSEDLCVSMKAKMDPGFDDSKMGKFIGLCGGDCSLHANHRQETEGWSARMVWANFEVPAPSLLTLIYHSGMTSPWGQSFLWKRNQKNLLTQSLKENWQMLDVCVKLNDIGKFNGVVRSYYNDTLVNEVKSLNLRKKSSELIDHFLLTVSAGNSEPLYAPARDSFLYIDEIAFYRRFDW